MLKNNKWKVILSSILILLPILFGLLLWDQLPETMITHFGADGNPDGTMKKAIAVFVLPLILLAVHLLCLVFTALDKSQKTQNKKALGIVFWIIPGISLFVNGMLYAVALEKPWNFSILLPLLMGIVFLVIGNYMPKITQNRTLGIKIYWTLYNEENWNKTHRFAGKLWVVCGIAMLFCAFLPMMWMFGATMALLLAGVILPMVYSYRLYTAHRKAGISYEAPEKSKKDKIIATISAIAIALILIFVAFLMFTGEISYTLSDSSLVITADFSEDLSVPFHTIDSVSYQQEKSMAMRIYGFNSARLSTGTFENDDLGRHSRYTYTGCDAVIVLTSDDETLVINCKTPDETQTLYQSLLEKVK